MAYSVCAEQEGGRWIAHVPDLPGCFATDQDRDAAIKAVPAAVEAYLAWAQGHGLHVTGLSGPMLVAEVICAWNFDEGDEVNAFFASDRPPLRDDELPGFERLLASTRQDLLGAVEGLPAEDLERPFPGERWPILGILKHVANADLWYLDRLGLALPRAEVPVEAGERLTKVREHMLANLRALASRTGVVTLNGETWSARKVMRRALWHERDHTEHIRKLRARQG